LKVELTSEEIKTILEAVRRQRDFYGDMENRINMNASAYDHHMTLDKISRCHDVLRALELDRE
jgi:hypothetical protein